MNKQNYHFLEDNDKLNSLLNNIIFPKLHEGHGILFTGAGFSVTDFNYLGDNIIHYYEDKFGQSFHTSDLVEFVDILSTLDDFNRDDFDRYVISLLERLKPMDYHYIVSKIPWNRIITTNLDTVIEQVYNNGRMNKTTHFKLRLIRNINEIQGFNSNDTIPYIKLNGCIAEPDKYPLVFGSDDFKEYSSYHKNVANTMKDISQNAVFISIGYSFSDKFSNKLLSNFNLNNFREKRILYNIDPFVDDIRLNYYENQAIKVLKLNGQSFFEKYDAWLSTYSENNTNRAYHKIKDCTGSSAFLPPELKLRIKNNLIQLSEDAYLPSIPQDKFYQGYVPTYDVVRRNYDVVFSMDLHNLTNLCNELFDSKEAVVPSLILNGNFGIGKSTFAFRLMRECANKFSEIGLFQILDPDHILPEDIIKTISYLKFKKVILFIDNIDTDSVFKRWMDIRNHISTAQIQECSILLLSSIRTNICMKLLQNRTYKNLHIYKLNLKLSKDGAIDLIGKLKTTGLVRIRDRGEESRLVSKVLNDFDSSTFLSLLAILQNSDLRKLVRDAMSEISVEAKNAIIYVSYLYQFDIPMAVGHLKRLMNMDWNKFENNIMRIDAKDLLIQNTAILRSGPDIYFSTPHPYLSQKIIEIMVKPEKYFQEMRKLINKFIEDDYSASAFVNLMKSFSLRKTSIDSSFRFTNDQINELWDTCATIIQSNQHFNIHYAMNLERRNSLVDLTKALKRLQIAEDYKYLDDAKVFRIQRNHRIIHRKGVIHFKIAKLFFKSEINRHMMFHHLSEASDFFDIKLSIDPFSNYSYKDYIAMELWLLEKMDLSESELIEKHLHVLDLFNQAKENLFEEDEDIIKLRVHYHHELSKGFERYSVQSLEQLISEFYESSEKRKVALILKYQLKKSQYQNGDFYFLLDIEEVIAELEIYSDDFQVAKILFEYYGHRLNNSDYISKFIKLTDSQHHTTERSLVKYKYYNFILECYNHHFNKANRIISEILELGVSRSMSFRQYWRDEDNEIKVFIGRLQKNSRGFWVVRIQNLDQAFLLNKKLSADLEMKVDLEVKLQLLFETSGIRAQIIDIVGK